MVRRAIIAVMILLLLFGLYYRQHMDMPDTEATPEPALEEAPAETEAPVKTEAPEASSSPAPAELHTHSWTPVYSVEHQEAEGHYETVVVKAAWDEPQYGTGYLCVVCGAGFKDAGSAAAHIGSAHNYEGSYYQGTVQVGSIHHEAETEQRWVQDTPEETGSVITGYICSCGETRAWTSAEKPGEKHHLK